MELLRREGFVKARGTGEQGSEEVDGAIGEEKDEGKGKEEAIEQKDNEKKKTQERKLDLWTVFELDSPQHHGPDEQKQVQDPDHVNTSLTIINSDLAPSLASNDSNSDLTAVQIALATRQTAIDQHELELVARWERIEEMNERLAEVQRAAGDREEALGRCEEAVEEREKKVRGREEKVVELEQAVDERDQALNQRGCELEERFNRVEELEEKLETCSAQLGGLNASTSVLDSNSWPNTLLRSVVLRGLGDKASSFVFYSCPSLLL